MRSRTVWAAALVLCAGCRMEGGRPVQQQAARPDSAAVPGTETAPLGHRVFSRRRDEVAPGLARVTVSTIVRLDIGQDSARKVMENLLADERRRDSTVAAIRILGYLPPAQGHGTARVTLVPLAYTDWAPGAFDSLSPATRRQPYRTATVFMHDAETLRAMGLRPSVGPLRPGIPRNGQPLPPNHPAPRQP
jgi:hypothetical protein